MRFLKYQIFVLILCLAQGAKAQKPFPAQNQIKLSPFKLGDLINPGIELSIERQTAKRFAMQLSYTFMTDLFGVTPYSDYDGNRFGIEEKYFVYQQPTQSIYFSLELLYAHVHYRNQFRFGPLPPGTNSFPYTYPDTVQVDRKTASINLKIGYQFNTRHFVFDVAMGLGIKHRQVTHSDRIAPFDEMLCPRHPNAYYEAEQERKSFTFNVPFVFKLGYCF